MWKSSHFIREILKIFYHLFVGYCSLNFVYCIIFLVVFFINFHVKKSVQLDARGQHPSDGDRNRRQLKETSLMTQQKNSLISLSSNTMSINQLRGWQDSLSYKQQYYASSWLHHSHPYQPVEFHQNKLLGWNIVSWYYGGGLFLFTYLYKGAKVTWKEEAELDNCNSPAL